MRKSDERLLDQLEAIEAEQNRLNTICTIATTAKAGKLQYKIEAIFNKIAKDIKTIEAYEERYSCEFEWEV